MAMTYQGPAIVIIGGTSITVEADLQVEFEIMERVDSNNWVVRERGLKSWLGTVQADPDETFREVLDARMSGEQPRLRLPDGREGSFVPEGTVLGSGRLTVTGTGPAPFWDEADGATA